MHINDVEELILQLDSPAHLKDAKTGKYLINNKLHADIYGFEDYSELNGMTIYDLDNIMHPYWGNNAQEMSNIEMYVRTSNRSVRKDSRVWLDINGHIWVHNMVKIPIHDASRKIISILTIASTLNSELSLNEKLNIYREYYKSSSQAIKKFLEYHNILQYFNSLPTMAELNVLIAKKEFINNKLIAQHLGLSIKTIETHISHLYQKSTNLEQVVYLLRATRR